MLWVAVFTVLRQGNDHFRPVFPVPQNFRPGIARLRGVSAQAEEPVFPKAFRRLPANLRAVGITEDIHFEEMADKTLGAGKKAFYPLEKEDIIAILKKSL